MNTYEKTGLQTFCPIFAPFELLCREKRPKGASGALLLSKNVRFRNWALFMPKKVTKTPENADFQGFFVRKWVKGL